MKLPHKISRFPKNGGMGGGIRFPVCKILKKVAQTTRKVKPSCHPTAAAVDKLTHGLTARPAGLMWDLKNKQNKLQNKHLSQLSYNNYNKSRQLLPGCFSMF